MDIITREDLKTLIQNQSDVCVSITMPAHRVTTTAREDRIRFQNLVRMARQMLKGLGRTDLNPEDLLSRADDLLNDRTFWFHQSDGLALFLTGDYIRHFRLPLSFEELVVVAPRFHVKPLMPMFLEDGKFFVLALSLNEVRVFQCSRQTVKELGPDAMPRSMHEALRYDDPQKQLQFHTGTQSFGQKRAAMFHGHGVGTDDTKSNILRFFQQVDAGLHELLRDEAAPLVLAGVDHLISIYREASRYSGLMARIVSGNPEEYTPEELHQKTWPIVEDRFKESREAAKEAYFNHLSTDLASKDLKAILAGSCHGRVDLMFVPLGVQIWGTYDPATDRLELHDSEQPGDEDLLNLAAVQTIIHGGKVFAVDPTEIPGDQLQAALFRF